MKNTLEQVGEQIKRFQSFRNRTGSSKLGSYSVSLNFAASEDFISVEFGGYDVDSWSRNERIETNWENLLKDVTAKVDEADRITRYERWCPKCTDYTDFDEETGICKGIWGDTCDVSIESLNDGCIGQDRL